MNGHHEFDIFVSRHRNQLESSGVPPVFWESLYKKLDSGIFDAGQSFSLAQVVDEETEEITWKVVIIAEDGIKKDDAKNIFLVDHAWTFRPQTARQQLESYPGLAERMCGLLDLAYSEEEKEDLIDQILESKWKLAQTYSIGNQGLTVEDRMPVWYILDEFGSRIQHSDSPNFRLVPFFSLLDDCAYSLLFPIEDCDHEDEVIRDYLEGPEAQDPLVRQAMMNIWTFNDVTEVDWKQHEPDQSFFEACRENENLPDPNVPLGSLPTDRKIKVFCGYDVISENLHHPRFEIVETEEEADILWLNYHYKTFRELSVNSPSKRINQFPFENVLTIKDLLCVVCRRMADTAVVDNDNSDQGRQLQTLPRWLPTTFNLKTELPQFVSYYQQREKLGLDNHWIVKPWNLARALDTHVSPELAHILKLQFSGPKIAQKYLEDPVLFNRPGVGQVKFDIRYILLLQSVSPLKVSVYNKFWLRFANVPFSLEKYDVYEKHFTVMNYSNAHLEQMFCNDFITKFEDQNPNFKWSEVQSSIFEMFRSIFEGASKLPPPCGLGHNPQSRAMYAADLMLAWDDAEKTKMSPRILEINWGPDCKRACNYYPEFFDNVLAHLFLGETEGQNVTEI